MTKINFIKMHGLGNDFVIIDNRTYIFPKDSSVIKKICNRKKGVGCDQLILIEKSLEKIADVKIVIYNCNGSEVETCGNATRCVGKMIIEEQNTNTVLVETVGGLLDVEKIDDNLISVDMGIARFDWRDIPLSAAKDNNNIGVDLPILKGGFVVNVGNPHVIFFTEEKNMDSEKIYEDCLKISNMSLFPQGININVAQIFTDKIIKLLVYERGVGFTDACGSGACATMVAAFKLGYTQQDVEVMMPGGKLDIEYMDDNHILMKGPVIKSFNGILDINAYK